MGFHAESDLLRSPKLGASWEGYAVEQAIRRYQPDEAYFWATHNGAELDLLLFKNGRRIGIECKHQDAPRLTPSMTTSFRDLKLDEIVVIYPGSTAYALSERVMVLPLTSFASGSTPEIV